MQDPVPFRLPFTHYAELGYHPIPIRPGEKVPAFPAWNTREYDYAELDRGSYSVGLLTDNLVGIDIDIDDAKTAAKLERITRKALSLPKASPVRVGRAPKRLLIVRVEKPFKSIDIKDGSRTLVQLLGQGKQFVIHGIHPDTKRPYTLSHALPHHDNLPLVTHTQLLELRAELCEALGVEIEPVRSRNKRNEYNNTRWSEREIDNYVLPRLMAIPPDCDRPTWIRVGMALHAGFHGDDEGFGLFDTWSSGELHEIRAKKYVESDTRTQWRSFKPGPVGTGTLDAIAKQHGMGREQVKSEAVGIDYADLLDAEHRERVWFVRDMFTTGAHLVVGRPKGGKSYLTLDLVLAVVQGNAFLERETSKTGVLWIAAEDTRDSLSERLRDRGVRLPRGSVSIYTMENAPSGEGTLHDWVDAYLADRPSTKLVVVDTQDTAEEIYAHTEENENTSVTKRAYQISRAYEEIAQRHGACVVLVMHTRKRNGKAITDYHELVNMAQTVVAGATASIVLADHPDRNPHEQDPRRVIAVRGRHIKHDVALYVEMTDSGFKCHGDYLEVAQTQSQADVMCVIEELLEGVEPDSRGVRWTTIEKIAKTLGKHRNTVQQSITTMKKNPAKMLWKQYRVVTSTRLGVGFVESARRNAE